MKPGESTDAPPGLTAAFAEYDRRVTLNNISIGCLLGMVLMPAGFVLDLFVYPEQTGQFLKLRLLCSGLIGAFWLVVRSPWGRRHHRPLGVLLAMFPTAAIAMMIHLTDGWNSPYYAGLNLVLLVVGFVVHWTFLESLVAVSLVMAMYALACVSHGSPPHPGTLINNLYFILLTGIVVVTGSYFQSRLRKREFSARFELDLNRAELEASNRKLVELDEIKSRFFANISHELRTPLTLLLAPLEAMQRQHGAALDTQGREWLQTMQTNGMRLLKLINDLLDLVRLESGRLQLKVEAVEIAPFLQGLATSVRKVAEDKGLRVQLELPDQLPVLKADRDKLEKVVLNLVFNAIKFTPAGGQITLRAAEEGDHLRLAVADTGAGISAAHLPHVFDRFWQADTSAQRKHQGVGIGLALVKELVEAHGGTVAAESNAGRGTIMTVRIPLVPPEGASMVEPPAEPEEAITSTEPAVPENQWIEGLYRRAELFPAMTSAKEAVLPPDMPGNSRLRKILVADDEPDMLRFLKSQLTGHFQVLEAVDGQQAIDKAAQFLPEIVLVDMMMPEKDGVQVCQELRQRTSTQSIPIIMLTARADDATKLAALNAGASDFLTKPFSGTELHVRIKNLVEAYELQRKLSRQNKILEATLEQLKETESQLVQSEKLASLGRMSAGIIHEINNPLNYAKTGLYTLKSTGSQLPEASRPLYAEVLKDIEEGIDRVKNIVSDLRTFTHPRADDQDWVKLEKVVTSALRFLSHEWKDKVDVQQRLPEGFQVWGNHNKLVQVVVNLLQNALDALRSKTFTDETPRIEIEGRIEGAQRLLVIRDNGSGIPSEHLEKVFDPFFTTKDVGQGMGLGLSICYRILEEHGGRIRLKNQPGSGCEFALEFPAEVPESAAHKELVKPSSGPGGHA